MFHGRLFKDNEVTSVFIYSEPVDISTLVLQKSEVDEVRWFSLDEVWEEIQHSRERFCVPTAGLNVLREYLKECCPQREIILSEEKRHLGQAQIHQKNHDTMTIR